MPVSTQPRAASTVIDRPLVPVAPDVALISALVSSRRVSRPSPF
jgi:hypothetical protein